MKVLHVVADMDARAGGVSKAVTSIVDGLNQLGITNEIACFNDTVETFIKDNKSVLHTFGPTKTPWGYSSKYIPWLRKNIKRYDTIIIHGLWQFHSYATYKVLAEGATNPKPKLLIMPHGMLDPWFQKATGRKLKAVRNWFFWKMIEGKIFRIAHGVLFTCETEKILARGTFVPYNPKNEFVVGLGIETPEILTSTMTSKFEQISFLHAEIPFILFLGRIDIKKGVDLLVRSYMSLKSSETPLPKLVIAGPGLDSEFGKYVKSLSNDDPDIIFPGMLTGDAKWGAIYNSQAFILPSHQENFGIAVVESLACGKPVLISDQVNIWHEINLEKSGIIEKDTLEGTKNLLLNFSNLNLQEIHLMGLNAQNTFKKYFTIETTAEKIRAIL